MVGAGRSSSIKRTDKSSSGLLMTQCFVDMIMNGEKSGFSRMMFKICRLVRIEQIDGR